MNIELKTKNNESVFLNLVKQENDSGIFYELRDEKNDIWLKAYVENNNLIPNDISENITESEEAIIEKLNAMYLHSVEKEQEGTENSEAEQPELMQPFNPDAIKVHAKPFSLRLIYDMIIDEDIDLSPDFQRNLVWTSHQKSRLIESILLRIPLPMFYFSEGNDGKITIVDGLQRLTTIKEFMNNEFPLKNLEYLNSSCEGRYYRDEGNKKGLDKKYKRWFDQTQFSVNVIDPSSPPKVKYDIFRRINTGGRPLNNQEIRNCLAGKALRDLLRKMSNLDEFKEATDYSIKSKRMADQEVALRFIYFKSIYDKDKNFEAYNGYMESTLNDFTESERNIEPNEADKFISSYKSSMKNAEYLFGSKYAFRKIRPKDLEKNANKQLINKALFVCWSVLLSDLDPDDIEKKNEKGVLASPLAEKIESDEELFAFLSYGTNSKANLKYVFDKANEMIKEHLNL